MKKNIIPKKVIPIKYIVFLSIILAFIAGTYVPKFLNQYEIVDKEKQEVLVEDITKQVVPEEGVNLDVSFGNSVVTMQELGAIDREKFESLYEERGGLPDELVSLFEGNSDSKITINQENANMLLNILWPLGLSNKTEFMKESPMGKEYASDIGNFASTGGWTLGKIDGGQLFNSLSIIPLTKDQEERVKTISQNIYRPCCGNSTYFPDCNHGAAMLGFLYLGVSQGMSDEEIYDQALAINSYWFPQTYVELATYFEELEDTSWDKVNAKEILGINYSSGQGYIAINKKLQDADLVPKVSGGGSCSV